MVDTAFQVAGTFTARQGRQVQSVVMAGATAARPLGARSGVRPGTSPTTVTATSTTVTVGSFAGTIDAQTAAEAGPYEFAFDAVTTMALTAQDPSNPRSDIVYARINDNAEDGGGATSAVRVYQAGTAGVGAPIPVPSVSPVTRALVVAVINVPKVGGGAPSVTWVAPYMAAAGGVVNFNTKAEMDLWTTAALRTQAVALDTGRRFAWDGSTWGTPEITGSVTAASGFTINAATDVYKTDGSVILNVDISKTSGTLVSGSTVGTIVAGHWPAKATSDACVFNNATTGLITISTAGVIQVYFVGAAATGVQSSVVYRGT